jgi:hypothetical protein
MRRSHRLIGGLAVAAVAIAVPVVLAHQALPSRTVTELASTPAGEFPVLPVLYNQQYPVNPVRLEKAPGGSQRIEVTTPSFPSLRGVQLELAIGTYLRAPTQTLEVTLVGDKGARLGSCTIPPSGYSDNAVITCPVSRPELLRRVVVSANGRAPLALYAANTGSQLMAGALVRERRLDSLGARLRLLGRHLGVLRPAPFSPPMLVVFAVLSTALLGVALLLALDAGGEAAEAPQDSGAPS